MHVAQWQSVRFACEKSRVRSPASPRLYACFSFHYVSTEQSVFNVQILIHAKLCALADLFQVIDESLQEYMILCIFFKNKNKNINNIMIYHLKLNQP